MTTVLKPDKKNIVEVQTLRFENVCSKEAVDLLVVEEPLEIFVAGHCNGEDFGRTLAVTMRTPGNDEDLAIGFLFSEGIIAGLADVENVWTKDCNFVGITLRSGLGVKAEEFERHSFINSSCGVCGKKSVESVVARTQVHCAEKEPLVVSSSVISRLPDLLRQQQDAFDSTGGIHAAALFDTGGKLLSVQEDVGRHNAVDKLIGSRLKLDRLPLSDAVLLLSGRASFELIQKAACAGISIVAAVGAPSSLAVQLAKETGVTLLGFVRNSRFNVYTNDRRIVFKEGI